MKVTSDLIKKYENLARKLAKPYVQFEDYEDIVQEARVGIWKGIESYDENSGTPILAYIYICAKKEVNKYFYTRYTQKRQFYNNLFHDEKGTYSTVSLDSLSNSGDTPLSKFCGYEDRDIENVVLYDAIDRALSSVFKTDCKATERSRNLYVDYLLLSSKYGSLMVIPVLQEKYKITRAAIYKVVSRYNNKMRKELAECFH